MKQVFAWALFDLANTFFAVAMLSFYFPLWIVEGRGGKELYFSAALAASMVCVALLMPFCGAISDVAEERMRFLRWTTYGCVAATALVASTQHIGVALALFGLANVCYQLGTVFYDALLWQVAAPGRLGQTSGIGASFGYLGSALGLLMLWPFVSAGGYQAAFVPSAALFLLFALPSFLLVREAPRRGGGAPWRETARLAAMRLALTVRSAQSLGGLWRYFWAAFFSLNAINTVLVFMGIYAKKVIGFTEAQMIPFFVFSQMFAMAGSLVFGHLTPRWGAKRTQGWIWAGWMAALGLLAAGPASAPWLWVAGPLIGFCLGSTWATSRVLIMELSPKDQLAEMFGLAGLFARASSIIGPLLWGLLVWDPSRYRLAVASLAGLLAIGLVLLQRVPEPEASVTQHEIAALFAQMADLLEYRGDNVFRVRAYRRAAQNLESFSGDLARLAKEDRLRELSGIGEDLANKIREYLATGKIVAIEKMKRAIPRGVLELLTVPGLGPKTAKLLTERLRITTLGQLESAAKAHRLQSLPGFQAKKEENLLKGLGIVKKGRERMDLGTATALAGEMLGFLRKAPGVSRVSPAGSLRRMKETIGDLDLLAASTAPERVMEAFRRSKFSSRVLAAGTTKSSVLTPDGLQVDLRVVDPESFGAALQYFTGSKEHNVRLRELAIRKGLKVNEYGVFRSATNRKVAGREEADVYRALGLPWVAPELREDQGEIDAAAAGTLPDLVEAKDIRGDFHIHTVWSDGSDSLEAMAKAGAARGYEYFAICDHSRSLRVAHGMSVERLREQMRRIRSLNAKRPSCRILMGAEVDILSDGSMDYPDAVLAGLDFVVGSIHSGFTQGEAKLTQRLIAAMRHPSVTLIAHPTGRLMGQREPYPVDLDAVFAAAKRTGTALELNAQPRRLDLTDAAARRARDAGVMLAISTDSHSLNQLDQMALGLGVARRAWLEPRHLLNCFTLPQLLAWIGRKRKAR